jgi:hypothetical protein
LPDQRTRATIEAWSAGASEFRRRPTCRLLGGRSPLDLIDADDLEPLAEYLAFQPALTSEADGDR